jgi:hypothetical protein
MVFGGFLHLLEGWKFENGFARKYVAGTYPGSFQVEKLYRLQISSKLAGEFSRTLLVIQI